ncbi:MAG: PPC domain-containing protein [Pseudomonadota bacterium]
MRQGLLVRLLVLGGLIALLGGCTGGDGGGADTGLPGDADTIGDGGAPDGVDVDGPPDTMDAGDTVPPDVAPDLPPDIADVQLELPSDLADVQPDLPPDAVELPETDVGKPCTTDADCDTNAGCLLGFCTVLCRTGDQEIAGACANPSAASAWGQVFACPLDLDVCVPGAVAGAAVKCSLDADCTAQGLQATVCAGAFAEGGDTTGLCLPILDRKIAGKSCQGINSGHQCASLFCLPLAGAGPTGPGMCSAWCESGDQCPGNTVCTLWGIPDPVLPGQIGGYAGLCVPTAGSGDACLTDLDCVVGKEYCGYLFPPGTDAPARACLDSDNPFGGGVGEDCDDASDCFGPLCLFHQWPDKVNPYCSTPCSTDEECDSGTVCRTLQVTPEGQPAPDGGWSAGFCVDPDNGAPCFTTVDGFCKYEWSQCSKTFGLSSWLGLCDDGVCPPDCDGKACQEDDGCGAPCLDACLEDGQICGDSGQCLSGLCVDGVCCDTACDGVCESCVLVEFVGTCTSVAEGTDSAGDCGVCSLCNGEGACAPLPAGEDPQAWCGVCETCDGDGGCIPQVDGVDPESDCGGCQTCDGAGGCRPIAAGLDPQDDCEEEAPETCGLTGVCDGVGACAWWGAEVICGVPTCENGIATEAAVCDGIGVCDAGAFLACHPYGCEEAGGICAVSCQDHGGCAGGYWCQESECVLKPACPLAASIGCGVQLMGSTLGTSTAWTAYDSCTDVLYEGPEKTYKLTLPKDTRVTLTLGDQTYDAALAVLDTWCSPEQACAGLVDQPAIEVDEVLTFDATAGTDYHIVVDGAAVDGAGQFSLEIGCCVLQCAEGPACGDDGCGGICGTCADGELCTEGLCEVCAEDPGGEPNETCLDASPIGLGNHAGLLLCPDTDEDWYSIALTEGQLVSVTLTQADDETGLALVLVPPSCGDPLVSAVGSEGTMALSWTALSPGVYRLRVSTQAGGESAYSLQVLIVEPDCVDDSDCAPGQICGFYQCVQVPPPCETLWELGCYDGISGNSTDKPSTLESYDRCTGTPWEGPDDKYAVSVTQVTVVTAILSGHVFHGGLAALEEFCASEWACVGFGDSGVPGGPVAVTFKALPGIPYYVVVEGLTEEDFGSYFLTLDCCLPQCEEKACGDDGCGLSCGNCENPQDLCIDDQCVCIGTCAGTECGDDGCGGTCGECFGPQDLCVDGACLCQPACEGISCGGDGCGGSCGECTGPQDACVEGQCICQPACDGLECGADGCDGVCGQCGGPQDLCVDGLCVCQPACEGKVCGDDGCGADCGVCAGLQDLCVQGLCVCQPACEGKVCGADGCVGLCGSCAVYEDCTDFQCGCKTDEGMEPNNTCTTAVSIGTGVKKDLAICLGGDEDWYAVLLGAGQTLTTKIEFAHADGDLDIYLYKQGNCVGYVASSSSSSDDEEFSYSSTTLSTYLIRVTGYNSSVGTLYDLSVNLD